MLPPTFFDGIKVLEVGAGLGFFSSRFQHLGAQVVATDIDLPAMKWLEDEYGIKTVYNDVTSEPLPEETFDLVFIGEVLEHVASPEDVIRRAKDRLAPSGKILVSTPAMEGGLIHSKGKMLGHEHGGEKHERDGFYRQELEELFLSQGLKISDYRSCVFYISELLMQLTKYAYLKQAKQYHGQSDVVKVKKSPLYKMYTALFPLLLGVSKVEESLLWRLGLKGHCNIVLAERA